jgi:hypothetical protein
MYILNRDVFVECTVHYELTVHAVAFSPCVLLGMALGLVTHAKLKGGSHLGARPSSRALRTTTGYLLKTTT